MGVSAGWYARRRLQSPPVLIMTGLDEEADVLHRVLVHSKFRVIRADARDLLDGSHSSTSKARPLVDYEIFFNPKVGNKGALCVLVSARRMGRLEAAVTASIACLQLEPAFVFLIGVAGGFRSNRMGQSLSLGDVIVGRRLYDLDVRKISSPDDVDLRARVFETPPHILALALAARSEDWLSKIPRDVRGNVEPKVFCGDVVSSDAVFASDNRQFLKRIAQATQQEFILETRDIPIGIEMEGSGVALAVSKCTPNAGFLMIRGVSDFADSAKKIDEGVGRQLAKYSAAVFAVETMKTHGFQEFLRLGNLDRIRSKTLLRTKVRD